MTAPMTDEQAVYLLATLVGLAQAARLIPTQDLLEHFEQRYREARGRGTPEERHLVLEELGFASSAHGFVIDAGTMMRARERAQVAEVEQAKAEVMHSAVCGIPNCPDPSHVAAARRQLEDEGWATDAPPRAR